MSGIAEQELLFHRDTKFVARGPSHCTLVGRNRSHTGMIMAQWDSVMVSRREDEWVWGWDSMPGIVSVWADLDGRASVWRRIPNSGVVYGTWPQGAKLIDTLDCCAPLRGAPIFSVACSEKIVDFQKAGPFARISLLFSWSAMAFPIIGCGVVLCFLSLAGGQAGYGAAENIYQRLAQRAYTWIIVAGACFVLGRAGTVSLFRMPSAIQQGSSTNVVPNGESSAGSQKGPESAPSKEDRKNDNLRKQQAA